MWYREMCMRRRPNVGTVCKISKFFQTVTDLLLTRLGVSNQAPAVWQCRSRPVNSHSIVCNIRTVIYNTCERNVESLLLFVTWFVPRRG